MSNITPLYPGENNAFSLYLMIVLFSLQVISGQGYEQGYIILTNKDTLYGKVKDRNDGTLFTKIRFKNERGKVKRYSAQDLLGYKVGIYSYESLWYAEESEFFRFTYYSRPGYGQKVFLKVLAKGKLSCYAVEFMHDDNNYPDQFELFLREGQTTLQRVTQGIFGLKKKQLTHYFWDCSVLVEKINNRSLTTPLEVVTYYNEFCGPD